jgi:hypothetical protein
VRRQEFPCPACGEQIRLRKFRPAEIAISILFGFLISFLAGARGVTFVFFGVVLYFAILCAYGLLLGWSGQFERAPRERTYIILPPGPRGKGGGSK